MGMSRFWQRLTQIGLGLGLAIAPLPALLPASSPLSGPIAQAQQPDFSEVEIQTVSLGNGIYMLTGQGGNIGVSVGEDGVFMIDDQFAPLTDKIRAAVAEISDQPVKFVLNTHWHFDHTGGNENFGNLGSVIVAHDNVRERMSTTQFMDALGREVPPSPEVALPVITFSDTTTFHINGQEICAFHVETAHTDGDSIVHFHDSNVIHMGDIYFNGLYPFVDQSSGGSLDGMIAAVEQVLELADEETQIIPGHGPLSDRDGLVVYYNLLRTVRDRIGGAIAQGKTLEQIIEERPLADLDEVYGNAFLKPEQFLRIVYSDLSTPR